MLRRRFLLAWVLSALLWLLPGHAAFADLLFFKCEHYNVHTDLKLYQAQLFARHMDRVFGEYERRFRSAKFTQRQGGPMNLYLLVNRDSYVQFLAGRGVDSSNTGGMFVVSPRLEGLITYVAGRPVTETLSVLQHEGFHQFAFRYIGSELPIWVNEGLAQYFEAGVFAGNQMVLNLYDARRVGAVKSMIQQNQTLNVGQMLTMSDQQWRAIVSGDAAAGGRLYDQAWSMTMFLIGADPRYMRALEQYLRQVGQGQDSAQAFAEAFGASDVAPFERAWRQWAGAMEPDDLSITLDRMGFLARVMLRLRAAEKPMPGSTAELRARLQNPWQIETRVSNGLTMQYDSRDESLYRYPNRRGAEPMFTMLSPERRDFPPRLYAPGLKPEPTLIWYTHIDGELTYDFVFR